MPRIVKAKDKPTSMPKRSFDNPQDGLWWHYAGPKGVEIVKTCPADFGKVLETEEPLPPALSGKKNIRVAASEEFVSPWERAEPGGQVLVIDPKKLLPTDWHRNLRSGSIIVLGEAAARQGELRPRTKGTVQKGTKA